MNIALVDGNYLTIRSSSVARNIKDKNDRRIGGIEQFLESLYYICSEIKAFPIICFDGNQHSKRRKEIYPEYKEKERNTIEQLYEKRKKLEDEENYKKAKNVDYEIAQKECIKETFDNIFFILKDLGIPFCLIPELEGDDLIYNISKELKNNFEVYCISDDDDFLQMLDEKVYIYQPMKRKCYTKDIYFEEFGFESELHVYVKAITGDKSDNIKGVYGLGEVYAKNLMKEFNNSVQDDLLKFVKTLKGKKNELLVSGYDIVLRNIEVIDISKEKLNIDINQCLKKCANAQPNLKGFKEQCSEFNLSYTGIKWIDWAKYYKNPLSEVYR